MSRFHGFGTLLCLVLCLSLMTVSASYGSVADRYTNIRRQEQSGQGLDCKSPELCCILFDAEIDKDAVTQEAKAWCNDEISRTACTPGKTIYAYHEGELINGVRSLLEIQFGSAACEVIGGEYCVGNFTDIITSCGRGGTLYTQALDGANYSITSTDFSDDPPKPRLFPVLSGTSSHYQADVRRQENTGDGVDCKGDLCCDGSDPLIDEALVQAQANTWCDDVSNMVDCTQGDQVMHLMTVGAPVNGVTSVFQIVYKSHDCEHVGGITCRAALSDIIQGCGKGGNLPSGDTVYSIMTIPQGHGTNRDESHAAKRHEASPILDNATLNDQVEVSRRNCTTGMCCLPSDFLDINETVTDIEAYTWCTDMTQFTLECNPFEDTQKILHVGMAVDGVQAMLKVEYNPKDCHDVAGLACQAAFHDIVSGCDKGGEYHTGETVYSVVGVDAHDRL